MGRPKRFLKILSVESLSQPCFFEKRFQYLFGVISRLSLDRPSASLIRPALHKKSWAVIDRPYSLGCATVGALYERPRCIFCAKPIGTVGQRITIEDHEIPEFARLESAKILGAADHRRGIAGHD